MPEGALTSVNVCDAHRHFLGQAYLLTSQSRSCTEYLIPTNDINLTNKYYLIVRFYDLIQFLIIW